MSKENVRQFYNHLAEDIALQERFKEMNARLVERFDGELPDEKQMDELFQKELLPVAKGTGFEFSLDDLKAYAAETKATTAGTCCMQLDGELADSELVAVVGGTAGTACVCVIGGYGTNCGGEMVCVVGGIGNNQMTCYCAFAGGGVHT